MALVVRDDRRVVTVRGEDRRTFLDAVLSQRVVDLAPGTRTQALWLDVHGAPLAAMDVLGDPEHDEVHLLVVADQASTVAEGLGGRTFLSQATFHLADEQVVAVRDLAQDEVPGRPGAGRVVREAGDGNGVLLVGRPDGIDVVGTEDAVTGWLQGAGLGDAGADLGALLDHEVRHGIPRAPFEIVGPQLPEEAGVLPTHVHLAKGCYPGQEAVARMWMLGRPRRLLVVLDVDGDVRPGVEAGAGRDRWRVTRVTSGPPLRALAFAPADAAVGGHVDGEGWTGTVVQVVGAGVPQPGADPAVTRRRDRRAAT